MNENIPQNWKMVQLEEVAAIVSGGTPSRDKAVFWGHDIPWVTPTDITNTPGRYLHDTFEGLSHLGLSSSSASLLPAGTILMTSRATVGDLRIAEREVCTNQGFKSLVPKKIEALFLFYQMQENREAYKVYGIGSTFLEVNKKDTGRFNILVPNDLQVQQKIGRILDTIDQAIEKTDALIHKYQQIKAGLMHDLFTRGLTADGKLRPPREQAPELYQETPVGWIPKEWEAKKLKDILIESGGYLQTGPFGSQLHAHEYTLEGIPVVMPQDINDGEIGTFNIARIPEKRAQILHRHKLKIGDIIIARRGELSRATAITEVEKTWICGTGCFLLRLGGSKLSAKFFSYAYRHDVVQRQVAGLAIGSTMPSLNNAVMNALYFPYVGINEQNRISERLELMEQQIKTLAEYKLKLKKQKSGLMHDLLTGKVSVKVDQEEPAHV